MEVEERERCMRWEAQCKWRIGSERKVDATLWRIEMARWINRDKKVKRSRWQGG